MNLKIGITAVIAIVLLGWIGWAYFIVEATEQLAYEVEESDGNFEIRKYEAHIIAYTEGSDAFSDMNNSFMTVADYIFGNNTSVESDDSSEKIAMTTPVINSENSYGKMAFVMPAEYSMETLPLPNNDSVTIEEVPAKRIASLRFSWFATDKRFQKKQAELEKMLEEKGLTATEFQIARYNPPLTPPFMMRNEVWAILEQ